MANLHNTNNDVPVATAEISMIPDGLLFMNPHHLNFIRPNYLTSLRYEKDSEKLAELIQKNYEAVDLRSYDNQPIRLAAPTEYIRTYVIINVVSREIISPCNIVVDAYNWAYELPVILQSDLESSTDRYKRMPMILPLSVLSGLQEGDTIDFYINGKVARLTARCYPCYEAPSSNGWLYI